VRVVIVLGLAAGCFRPDPVTGSPCSDSQPCPKGLICTFGTCEREPITPNGDAPPPDLPNGDGGGGGLCFGGFVRVCLASAPTATLAITADTRLDTDAAGLCVASDHPELCVVAGAIVSVSGTLRATGARPLVVLSASQLMVSGVVDVASRRSDNTIGAGADSGDCTSPPPDMSSGGPGGSFGGSGGAGAGSGTGGVPGPVAGAVTGARGGCPGTAGGDASGTGGAGGHGGGAVVLIATAIDIQGKINASGAGGGGGAMGGGGGGGGSGGLIVLDASSLAIATAASVFANGGGGGATGAINTGNPGQDPTTATTPAAGGAGISGSGGAGSAGAKLDGVAGQPFSGGGGGGAGVIRLFGGGAVTGAVSPPAS
jgi:hypothetical protein